MRNKEPVLKLLKAICLEIQKPGNEDLIPEGRGAIAAMLTLLKMDQGEVCDWCLGCRNPLATKNVVLWLKKATEEGWRY